MLLRIGVLAAAVLQVVAPIFVSIGTFQDGERMFPVLIQPSGWAFSVWGLIYTLSLVYAIYQLIPKFDNSLLHKTRIPALCGFLGSVIWLYFSGQEDWQLWLTIPTLMLMAFFFTVVIRADASVDPKTRFLSQRILFPYAAWTGIAFWLNVQAVPLERGFIETASENALVSASLFIGLVCFTSFYFKKTSYSVWYGGVLIWASIGVVVANLQEYDNHYFAAASAVFGATICTILITKLLKRLR